MVSLIFFIMQNELCRMKLDIPILDELVREYCLYRGIIDASLPFPSGKSEAAYLLLEFGFCSKLKC